MDNLNKSGQNPLEMEDTNFITLLKNPQKFKETFYQIASISSQSLKAQQFQKALKALTKCADMLDLGKNILKDISKYWKLCINANLACAYQGTWKMPKCNKYCEKVEEQIQRLSQASDSRQSKLNLNKCLIRLRFQHCAILSQLNQHQKALQLCKSTLGCLQKYIRSILEYAQSLQKNTLDGSKSSQTIQFRKQVTQFAEQILNNLLKNLTDPITLNNDKTPFYYWQKNPENNEDQVKKKFVSPKSNDQCKRSILGVNKMTHWIDQFNIGTIMLMSQLTVKDFENCLPVEEYIFKDKLYQTVIYCSVAHFTIATEMRFIQSSRDKYKEKDNKQKQKNTQKQKSQNQNGSSMLSNQPSNLNMIIKKYGFREKSQMFQMSELYHLRAINIIAQNIKSTVPYISHLIKSYDKHYIYKKQLQPVIAIEDQSLLSMSQINSYKNKQRQKKDSYRQQQQQQYFYRTSLGQEKQGRQLQIKDDQSQDMDEDGQQGENLYSLKNAKIVESRRLQRDSQAILSQNFDYLHSKSKQGFKSMGALVKTQRDKLKSKSKSKHKFKTKFQSEKVTKKQRAKEPKKQKAGKSSKHKKQVKQKQKQSNNQKQKQKQKQKKKDDDIEGQVRINHQSCTQIKVLVFKKKK